VTEQGLHVLGRVSLVEQVMQMMDMEFIDTFNAQLAVLLRQALTLRQNKTFGLCRSCRHHKKTDLGGHCGLLNEPLHAGEELQICQEFAEKAPGMDTVGD
jgi:hypothetical protein